MIIAGEKDQHTTIIESRRLFEEANSPKYFWEVKNAIHQNYYEKDPEEYENRVLYFLNNNLREKE